MAAQGEPGTTSVPCAYHELSKMPDWLVRLAQVRSHVRARGVRATISKVAEKLGVTRPAAVTPVAERGMLEGEVLALVPGEWVEVKSAEEIRETLNDFGAFRGLYFMDEMWNFCGQRFRVLKRMERLMVESTGHMRTIRNTVLLDGTVCDGSSHRGCDATCHHLWREMWLRRVEGADETLERAGTGEPPAAGQAC